MTARQVGWSGRGHMYTDGEVEAAVRAMREADPLTQGRYLTAFEAKFKEQTGAAYAFAVSTCTAALDLAAVLSRVGPGDDVLIPGHTFCATAIPFAATGARLVWADIDPNTWVVTAETLRRCVTPQTRVIVAVHLYGLMCPMAEIMALAAEHDCLVVEDAAQAIGASCHGAAPGTMADFGCFSFHTHKNASTLGEGGMLTVKSEAHAALVPRLRHNGICAFPERKFFWRPAMGNVDQAIPGVWPRNHCLGEVQCAVGIEILDRVGAMNVVRRSRYEGFVSALGGYPQLSFQAIPDGYLSSHHLLAARYTGAGDDCNHDFIERMNAVHGIKVIVQYYPLYRYDLFVKNGFGEADCLSTDAFFDNMVSWPNHQWLDDGDVSYMIEATIETIEYLKG